MPFESSYYESSDDDSFDSENLNLPEIPNFNYEEDYYEEKTENNLKVVLNTENNVAEYEQKIIIPLDDICVVKGKKKSKKPMLKNTIKLIEGINYFNLIKNVKGKSFNDPENKRFFMRKRKNVDYAAQRITNHLDVSSEDNSSDFENLKKNKKLK